MEIHIQIRFADAGFPPPEILAIRHDLEDSLIEQQVGTIVAAGAGMGVMDLYVEVADPAAALPVVQSLLRERDLQEVTTVRVVGQAAA